MNAFFRLFSSSILLFLSSTVVAQGLLLENLPKEDLPNIHSPACGSFDLMQNIDHRSNGSQTKQIIKQ